MVAMPVQLSDSMLSCKERLYSRLVLLTSALKAIAVSSESGIAKSVLYYRFYLVVSSILEPIAIGSCKKLQLQTS